MGIVKTELELLRALAWLPEIDDDSLVEELALPRLSKNEFSDRELEDLLGGEGKDITTSSWNGFELAARVGAFRHESLRHDLLAGRALAYACLSIDRVGFLPMEVIAWDDYATRVVRLNQRGLETVPGFIRWLNVDLEDCYMPSSLDIASFRRFDYTYTFSSLMLMRSVGTRAIDFEVPSDTLLRVVYSATEDNLGGMDTHSWIGELYVALVRRQISVATPISKCSALQPMTLLSSCFLMSGLDIPEAQQRLFEASNQKGGVGLSLARETDILPALDIVASTIRYSRFKDQERPLTVACYLPDWHHSILDLLTARIPKQDSTAYFPLVFTGVMVHDLFMEAVTQDKEWHLFSPDDAYPALVTTSSFAETYQGLVEAGKATRKLPARTIFEAIVRSLLVSGTPYVIFSDRVNLSSMQAGHIECSNLCAEVMLHSDSSTVASCFLSSIALSRCLFDGKLDYNKVSYLTTLATHFLLSICARTTSVSSSLDIVADTTKAIGIGVQGLSDTLQMMGIEYDSDAARAIAAKVAACMQYWSMATSIALEMDFEFGCNEGNAIGPHHERWHSTLPKSACPLDIDTSDVVSSESWVELVRLEERYGRANATCIAMMPTVTTAHMQGNSDGIETRVGNVIVKRSSSGDDTLVNPVLWSLLKKRLGVEKFNGMEAGLLRDIARADGSVSGLEMLTAEEKRLFRTAFEIDVLGQLGISAAMTPFVDQSISTNWFMRDPSTTKVTSYLIKAWKYGLKTGIYYLRQATAIQSLSTLEEARPSLRQTELSTDELLDTTTKTIERLACTPDCTSCSA